MSYLWEEYQPENYYFIPQKKQSYYQEIWRKDGKYVPVNIYNRFEDIFFPMELNDKCRELEKRYKKDDKFKDVINVFFHELVMLDRLDGITLEDIEMALLYDDIDNELYGKKIKILINNLNFEDLYIILKELLKTRKIKNTISLFDEVLHLIFGKTIIYKENSSGKTFVYIEKARDEYNEKLFELIVCLFADMGLDIECIWANEHFGITGNSSTMRIGSISIY